MRPIIFIRAILVGIVLLILMTAVPVFAVPPVVVTSESEISGTFFCGDFDINALGIIRVTFINFLDEDGNVTRLQIHNHQEWTYTNSVTGTMVRER